MEQEPARVLKPYFRCKRAFLPRQANDATCKKSRMRFPQQTQTVRRPWKGCRPFD